MKQLLFITMIVTLFSCTKPTRENSVTDPLAKTTMYLKTLPKDTLIVSYEDKEANPYIYVWSDELITEVHTISNSSTVDQLRIIDILVIIFVFFIGGIGVGIVIES